MTSPTWDFEVDLGGISGDVEVEELEAQARMIAMCRTSRADNVPWMQS
jgi:hypothetical protein